MTRNLTLDRRTKTAGRIPKSNQLTPYYDRNGVTLYCGDARRILPLLAQRGTKAQLCLTDPPYGQNYVTEVRAKNDPLRKPIVGDKDLSTLREVAALIDPVMDANSHLYFFASSKTLLTAETVQIVLRYWKYKQTLVWDKGLAGTVGDVKSGYAVNYEMIVYAIKGRRQLQGARPRGILQFPWSGSRNPIHPTPKPVGLLQRLILNSTKPHELVIDPFAGSGATLVAARNTGRRAIGIEIEKKYCDATIKRLELDFELQKGN